MSALPLVAGVELGGTKCVFVLASGPAHVVAEELVPTTAPDDRRRAEHGFAAPGLACFGLIDVDPASPIRGSIIATPKPGGFRLPARPPPPKAYRDAPAPHVLRWRRRAPG